jgi:hypothetical protein
MRVVVFLAAPIVVVASSSCFNGECGFPFAVALSCACSADADCGAGQTCLTGTCSGGEGEGEGEGDDTPGASCAHVDANLGVGNGAFVATDAALAIDTTNVACTAGATNACNRVQGTSCFTFDISVTGSTASAIEANNASWISFAAVPASAAFTAHSCNGGSVKCAADPSTGRVACVCGLCLFDEPTDLAAAVDDGTNLSNGVCVTLE